MARYFIYINLIFILFSNCEKNNDENIKLIMDTTIIKTVAKELPKIDKTFDSLTDLNIVLHYPLMINSKCINNLCLGEFLENIHSTDEYKVKDTIIEGEVSWPGKAIFNKKGELVILAEANWVNKKNVSRIIILGNEIKNEDSISVGMNFKETKGKYSDDIPTVNDGSILLVHKTNKNLFFEFNTDFIEDGSKLFYGVRSLEEVPDSLKIQYIMIM